MIRFLAATFAVAAVLWFAPVVSVRSVRLQADRLAVRLKPDISYSEVQAQRGGRGVAPGPAPTPQAAAPIDITGYWVSLVTDDWRWRMVTPPKGDYLYLPLNPAGRQAADAWDPTKDEAAGEQCKGYGAPSIMHLPGPLPMTWEDDSDPKLDGDAGPPAPALPF